MILLATISLSVFFAEELKAYVLSFGATVELHVIHFDPESGKLSIEFRNETDRKVPLESLYMTLSPTGAVSITIPAELSRKRPLLSKTQMLLPGGAAFEVGELIDEGENKGRMIRLAVPYLMQEDGILLPLGAHSMTLSPNNATFSKICQQFAESAKLQLALHITLVDPDGNGRKQEIPMGIYEVASNSRGITKMPRPRSVDVYRKATSCGSTTSLRTFTFPTSLTLPVLRDDVMLALFCNNTPHDVLLSTSKNVEGEIIAMFVNNDICYSFGFDADIGKDEKLDVDIGSWQLTCDNGATTMSVVNAFLQSETLPEGLPSPGVVYQVHLPPTNWHIRLDNGRWAPVRTAVIEYQVRPRTWVRRLSPDDANEEFVISNMQAIINSPGELNPSLVPMDQAGEIDISTNTFFVIENRYKPDFSVLLSQKWTPEVHFFGSNTTSCANISEK